MITATVVADSIPVDMYYSGERRAKAGTSRLTTFVLSYPRFIHAEVMTHRVFSRNAASSRAIPISKMIERATKQTAMPVHWGKNQKGMQADEELSGKDLERAKALWISAAETMAGYAKQMSDIGVHKQIANRLIENFQNIEVVVTSSSWANFYALRNHADAQPEIRAVAQEMLKAQLNSQPSLLATGDWHLPFVGVDERDSMPPDLACKVSAARCARVSYLTHDKKVPSTKDDLDLFTRLMGGDVKHASPTEHQATPADSWLENKLSGNLSRDWVQFRQTIKDNVIGEYGQFR